MKLIRCNKCNDVVRLIKDKWRTCECGKSGGQYNDISLSVTVGGCCEVIGIRNDFFEAKQFTKDRIKDTGDGLKNIIIQGEYLGDNQVFRILSSKGPKLKLLMEKLNDYEIKITFIDRRQYKINLKGNKSPKTLIIPYSDKPSFKYNIKMVL